MKVISKLFLLLVLVAFPAAIFAGEYQGEDPKGKTPPAKTMTNDNYDFISINSILMYISNNGSTSHDPRSDAAGLEWPQGSGKHAVFQDGIIWGGLISGVVRVGGSTYRQGMEAGPIQPDGSRSDPDNPSFRIYKIRKVNRNTYKNMAPGDTLRLRTDFLEWPVADGAPWIDSNHDGVYNPDFDAWLDDSTKSDKPWFIGDEELWFVSNDLDGTRTTNLYGCPPIGIETQTFVWGYSQTGPLGNMIFEKQTVINKGSQNLDRAYLAQWSDPDLGDANDDFVGVDTSLVLGYVYNGLPVDGIYGIPPAMGYDFFQGPMVPGRPGEVAHFKFGLRPGYKNLGISSFAFYINGSGVYADPTLGTAAGATQMYNYMKGLLWNGNPFIDPTTGQVTTVTLAGDPVTRTGWIDGIVSSPGDRRLLLTAGPFTLAVGDTQEIVVGKIIALGADRISSVQVLKYYDEFAQRAFDQNFDLYKPPPAPVVENVIADTLRSGIPKRIILTWGDKQSADATEHYNDRGYAFEGYNVYQFPAVSSTLADAKRIATYDLVNNVLLIFDNIIDPKTGAIVSLPVQFGNDTGVKRYIDLNTDFLTDRPIVNNQPYYYAVTAYSYNPNPEAVPKQLESTPHIFVAYAQTPNPGYRYGALMTYAYSVPVMHTTGTSNGSVLVNVLDPMLLTGDSYEVTFNSLGKVPVIDPTTNTPVTDENGDTLLFDTYGWNLTNITKGTKPLVSISEYAGNYYPLDGFRIGLNGFPHWEPGKEIRSVVWTGDSVFDMSSADGAIPWQTGNAWGWGTTIPDYLVNKSVEIRFSNTVTSKGYLYTRSANPSYAFQGYVDCPFTVWDISNPDSTKWRQLEFAFVEQQGGPHQDRTWDPVDVTDREYLFILDKDYSDTPDPAFNLPISTNAPNMPILYACWLFQPAGVPTYGQLKPWKDGDKFIITANIPFTDADKFTFTTAKPTYETPVAQKDITGINVFPNPYLGVNAKELNKYQRFVTFNHLPPRAHFRVFTVSGTLVRSFVKDDASQLAYWDLQNDNGLPVASGMYIIHIDMPDLGVEKILKLGVVLEAQFLDRI